jgi:hypothetical protein
MTGRTASEGSLIELRATGHELRVEIHWTAPSSSLEARG